MQQAVQFVAESRTEWINKTQSKGSSSFTEMEKVKILWLINYSCRSNNIFRSLYRFLAIQLQTTYRRCISYKPFKHFTP